MPNQRPEISILLVEDQATFAVAIKADLVRKASFKAEVTTKSWLHAAIESLSSRPFDVVLLDLSLPDSSGLDTLHAIVQLNLNIPIVVLTGNDDEELAISALQAGAQEYVLKGDIDGRALARAIVYSIERNRVQLQLRSLTEQRDDFMAVISHDVKNSLIASRRIFDSMLHGKSGALNPEQTRLLQLLEQANDDCLRLTHDLLELYRYKSGSEVLRFQTVSLGALVERSLETLLHFAQSRSVKLVNELSDTELLVSADRNALIHVISNLVHNAIKFSPEGAVVAISGHELASMIALQIRNTGEGIAASEQELLFRRFSQGRLGKDTSGGSGLGLYLSYQIVQLHQGRLTCVSDPGVGTVFAVALPSIPRDLMTGRSGLDGNA